MRLYSYVVARDYGFAPNPFFEVCTLATCKPEIRRGAKTGDLILGTGSAKYKRSGQITYIMKVEESLSFDDYWSDPRYARKRPILTSLKLSYGDNIYHTNPDNGAWIQENSHHSFADGQFNQDNIDTDTKGLKVLTSKSFIYWGGTGPEVPPKFRDWNGVDICARRNYKNNFPDDLVEGFSDWFNSIGEKGYIGDPHMFSKYHRNHI